jgi:hypothetical protein
MPPILRGRFGVDRSKISSFEYVFVYWSTYRCGQSSVLLCDPSTSLSCPMNAISRGARGLETSTIAVPSLSGWHLLLVVSMASAR